MIFRHACPLNSLSHNVIVFWLTLQRYGKSREIQNESSLLFLLSSESDFGEAKSNKSLTDYADLHRFFLKTKN